MVENLFYVNTDNKSINEILDFCEDYLLDDKDSEYYNEWLLLHKDNFELYYPHSNILIFDDYARLLAVDDQDKRSNSGHIIWTSLWFENIETHIVEYFDFDEYNAYVDSNYKIVEAGLDENNRWVYLKAESLTTHHRSYLLNWTKYYSIDIYKRRKLILQIYD